MNPLDKAIIINQENSQLSERERVVVQACATKAKTLRELSVELNVGYYTARNIVNDLLRLGFLRVQPFRRDRQQVYLASFAEASGSTLQYVYQGRSISADRVWGFFSRGADANPLLFTSENVAGILAHLMRRARLAKQGFDLEDLPYPPPVVSRNALVAMRRNFGEVITLMDQLIASPIWRDSDADISLGYEALDPEAIERFSDLWVARSPKQGSTQND